jgi:hypothetical protein
MLHLIHFKKNDHFAYHYKVNACKCASKTPEINLVFTLKVKVVLYK